MDQAETERQVLRCGGLTRSTFLIDEGNDLNGLSPRSAELTFPRRPGRLNWGKILLWHNLKLYRLTIGLSRRRKIDHHRGCIVLLFSDSYASSAVRSRLNSGAIRCSLGSK